MAVDWLPLKKKLAAWILRSSAGFEIVRPFLRQHGRDALLPGNLARIQERLRSSGFRVTDLALSNAIEQELEDLAEEQFRRRVLYNNPIREEQILENYLQAGIPRLDLLRKVLEERGYLCIGLERRLAEHRKNSFAARVQQCLTHPGRAPRVHPLDFFDPKTFWRFGEPLFRSLGYEAHCTTMTNDDGGDLVADGYGERLSVQITHVEYPVQARVRKRKVQEVISSLKTYGADRGMVLSNGRFTKGGKRLAELNNVQLIGRDELVCLLSGPLAGEFPWLNGIPWRRVIGYATPIPKTGLQRTGTVYLRVIRPPGKGRSVTGREKHVGWAYLRPVDRGREEGGHGSNLLQGPRYGDANSRKGSV